MYVCNQSSATKGLIVSVLMVLMDEEIGMMDGYVDGVQKKKEGFMLDFPFLHSWLENY